MKFSTTKKALLPRMKLMLPVILSKAPRPELECIKFTLIGDRLTLTATDLNTTLMETMEVNGHSSTVESIILHGRRFEQIINTLPYNDTIDIEVIGETLTLKCLRSKFKVQLMNLKEYPKQPNSITTQNKLTISSHRLRSYAFKTLSTVSTDTLRAVLTGVLFHLNTNQLTLVSTDSVMLSFVMDKQSVKYNGETDLQAILPHKAIYSLNNSLLGEEDVPVTILFDPNYAEVRIGDTITIFTRLINGKYPAYKGIIPVDRESKLVLNRKDLKDFVTRVSISSNPLTHVVSFFIDKTNNNLTITAEDSTCSAMGEDTLSFKAINIKEDMRIGINSMKLITLLKHIETEEVMLEIKETMLPLIITPVGSDIDTLNLLMPVKLT